MASAQDYKNHTRWDWEYHFVVAPILILNFIATGYWYGKHYHQHVHSGAWLVLVSVALLVLGMRVRVYALRVQDRVIRLEEKLRIASLVSPSEQVELESLTIRQYVALRFASNAELPELARRAVRENLSEKQIKEAVKSWRADEHRV